MCKINKMTICQAQLTSKLLNYFYETSIYNIEEMEMSELLYISICNNSFTYTNLLDEYYDKLLGEGGVEEADLEKCFDK
jgi:hypothetical protein